MFKRFLSVILVLATVVTLVPYQAKAAATKRYSVLVIDASEWANGTPMTEMKKTARKFIDASLAAYDENYVTIVPYASELGLVSDFSKDPELLKSAINNLVPRGGSNMNAALLHADKLLSAVPNTQDTIKNIIIMTSGIADTGETKTSGELWYQEGDYKFPYENAVYDTAEKLKSKYKMYSFLYPHNLLEYEMNFIWMFTFDLQNSGHYKIEDGEEINFSFGGMDWRITNSNPNVSGIFRYPGIAGDKDYSEVFHYREQEYFAPSSYVYNSHLATMSMCLAMAVGGSLDAGTDYTMKSKNARDLFTQIGFSNFAVSPMYNNKPTMDSIGAVAASKKIKTDKEYTLIALAVRGIGYESEWASNFTLGRSGNHKGFEDASNEVKSFLYNYINDNNIKGDIKLWITGYSRAAAVANLLAGNINGIISHDASKNKFGGCDLQSTNMYVYTYATPRGTNSGNVNDGIFRNIYNHINPNDIVPKVAPDIWDFNAYGVRRFMPTIENDKNFKEMKLNYNMNVSAPMYQKFILFELDTSLAPTGSIGAFIPSIYDNTSQEHFLNTFVDLLCNELFITRSGYEQNFQDKVRSLSNIFFGMDATQSEKFNDSLMLNMITNMLLLFNKHTYAIYDENAIIKLATDALNKSLISSGVSNYSQTDFKNAVEYLASIFIIFSAANISDISTVLLNINSISQAHYPELYLAWLQSMDSYYTENPNDSFVNG
jgi:hypothetical protein